ncbi:MAG: NAD-dependent epimerase/dehydratase family protein [Candidatus Nanopelagicales bacterium]
MAIHTVVGAGQVGTRLAALLVDHGHDVRLVSRRGNAIRGAEGRRADASDLSQLLAATAHSDVIYNCINPPYTQWQTLWPPMADNLIAAAEASDAVLVTLNNLYGYGPVNRPMTEDLPMVGHTRKGAVRADMWHQALAAHEKGRIRMTEVRASDYIGEAGDQTNFGDRVIPKLRAGKALTLMGRTDQPHTWTYTGDAARLLSTVAGDERAWGRPWHVPSPAPRTQAEVIADLAAELGVPVPKIRTAGKGLLGMVGIFNPDARQLVEMLYEFDRPFVMDSSRAQATFGLEPTAWPDIIAETLSRNAVAA